MGKYFCIGYIETIEELYILYSISEILLFTAVVLVLHIYNPFFSQEELTLASGSVSTGFSIGSILSITIFTNLANILPLHDIFFICGLGDNYKHSYYNRLYSIKPRNLDFYNI